MNPGALTALATVMALATRGEAHAPAGVVADVVTAGTRAWIAVFTHPAIDRICGLGYGSTVPPGWPNGAAVCGPPADSPGG